MQAVKQTPPALGPLARRVHGVLGRYTAFPWPALESQCARCGFEPFTLTPTELGSIIAGLTEAIARFNSHEEGEKLRRELVDLLRSECEPEGSLTALYRDGGA